MPASLYCGDCLEILPTLAPGSVHSCVTDPPYHLTAGKKGGTGEASVNLKTPAGRARVTCGFMGKKWDGGDVAFQPETWAKVFRVLKPGAHLVAFSGTRTYHRMVCAIEDAGFEIRDQLAWIYGSGFPKSSNQEGEWQGWGTALKPAWEPIVLARKPLIGTVRANLDVHRTGALGIEGCRVEASSRPLRELDAKPSANGSVYVGRQTAGKGFDGGSKAVGETNLGRWPANIAHDGSDEVLSFFPESKGQCADLLNHSKDRLSQGIYGDMRAARNAPARGDAGSAARFFYCAKAPKSEREAGLREAVTDDGRHTPIDNPYLRGETKRLNTHPTVKPTRLMQWLCRLVTPPEGTILDPFMGSGSTGRAALLEGFDFLGIEREPEYLDLARARIADVDLI